MIWNNFSIDIKTLDFLCLNLTIWKDYRGRQSILKVNGELFLCVEGGTLMDNMLSIMRTIFHIFLVGCCFVIVSVLTGVIDFADIWLPLQNIFRV